VRLRYPEPTSKLGILLTVVYLIFRIVVLVIMAMSPWQPAP
jgi:hypothetical protein